MSEKFSSLNPDNKLFRQLLQRNPRWWENIIKNVRNKKLYVDIRKDNYIDVYCNGGAILHRLSYTNGFKGSIHFEYMHLITQGKNSYIPFDFSDDTIKIDTTGLSISKDVNNFSANGISKFQKRIGMFFSLSSEKGIQADFVLKNSAFLDTEFQYKTDKGAIRFDLVWVDVDLSKLFVIELKTIGDPRLYFNKESQASKDYDKIDDQLNKYREFIREQSQNLLSHYEKLFIIKKKLGILPDGLQGRDSLSGFAFEERPILLVADCTESWIKNNSHRLNEAIKHIAYGCFYQGKNTRRFNIPKKNTVNKFVWP